MQISAEYPLPKSIGTQFSPDIQKILIEYRNQIHQIPELAFQEFKTQAKIIEQLQSFGITDIQKVAKTGVIATIPGTQDGPVIAIRGDIDGLPIQEKTGHPFESIHEGFMHACGHDMHNAWTMAAAYLATQTPAKGPIKIVFQPAEETAKGAKAILESGRLDDVKAIFAAHVDRRYNLGKVVVQNGAIAAYSDVIKIKATGIACHAARPEEGKNPIPALSTFIHNISDIQDRFSKENDLVILSITQLDGGQRHNMIPEQATAIGSLRTMTPETRSAILKTISKIADDISKESGVQVTIEVDPRAPGIINRDPYVSLARQVVTKTLGEESEIKLFKPNLASEDFGEYLKKMDGCFLRIGAKQAQDAFIPVHTSYFFAEDACIFIGGAILYELAYQSSFAV